MRLTKQTIDTLLAVARGVEYHCNGGKTGADRDMLAKDLGIPYSSLCSRLRRLLLERLIEGHATFTLTERGVDAVNRGVQKL